jgi:transposase-like zinc-binding protein
MTAATPPAWPVCKQLCAEHWDGFTRVYPRYATPYYDGRVAKMLGGGAPAKLGSIAYRCLPCGQGKHLVAMRCKASLCLRCAQVDVATWVSQVSPMRHEGVI